MDTQDIIRRIAALVPQRDEAIRLIEEMETAFKAEAAELYTREKRLKEEVESLKQQLRDEVRETGEVVVGVTRADVQVVSFEGMDEADVVTWCCQYAPELLTLRGTNEIRKWFFRSNIQTTSVGGKPQSIFLAEKTNEAGQTYSYAVPCPFHIEHDTQVRVSENAIVTAVDEQKWSDEHGK